ncbi:imidazole glycerol phosphate synthase subunit HisH [Kurthia sibirica]|uniref:Imidazole glycerol phosphate synthase subunit HisH n=1 Tax=Kurthia sibirica TaxID=202750 RepID=A0A2U3AJH8_9BACL|nr:imidazole glycerol phosphate synthase subunit HisH [Kurthia sibirica]PWI24621.1 imidazole glycerol phosphate synthase subunit HisH [Kurthia sibirica]GEK33449.1 imidazole glycerol phosphate synthase subunit HisH [Kurthia sibirica]
MKIGIIDYGMGNLFSVEQAVKRLGVDVVTSSDATELQMADALILPGVGAFEDAIKCLDRSGLCQLINDVAVSDKPLLGICLGMQLLFESSEENGQHKGLGILKGHIKKFSSIQYRIPHMGWNNLHFPQPESWLTAAQKTDGHVYFVHSYYASQYDEQQLSAYAQYADQVVPAIVHKDNVTGMQFHPEKSGECGMALLEGWLNTVQVKEQTT